LPDPERILVGKGARIRHVRIGSAADLERPVIRALLRAAVAQGRDAAEGERGAGRAMVKAVYVRKRRPV
jgi:hypothetical protein